MNTIHPPQNPCPAVIFTPSGYIRGTFHVPTVKTLRAFLNAEEEILKLTDVVLPGSSQVQPFLALHKNAVLMVVPQPRPELLQADPGATPRERRLVTCLMSMGSLRGSMETPETIRTSDFLLRNPGFIELHHCHIGPNPYLSPEELSEDAIPVVMVNSRTMVGLAEAFAEAVPVQDGNS